jgi:hypothetical protein
LPNLVGVAAVDDRVGVDGIGGQRVLEWGAFCAQEVDELALRREDGFHAGRYRIGYQACDDSRPSEGADPAQCAANARAFALDTSVIGVIGAYDSGCTGIELPTLNAAPSGGDRRAPRS